MEKLTGFKSLMNYPDLISFVWIHKITQLFLLPHKVSFTNDRH